ncbi:tyrosine-type recombinase/integrase [Kitasatospora misakiensis]|uniref:Tyrosine-type recombinase/integrase n=1 Tax=Kitasatospora misakiensis TaxID=67330 RepID=A0ABW0XAS8_9ACTN
MLDEWLDGHGVLDGQPFLISPAGAYDADLNRYFATALSASPWNTQAAAARDLRGFLNFLWFSRPPVLLPGGGAAHERSWQDAVPEDRAAYERWRRKDPAGPRVEDSTWDREVSTVNEFYRWAISTDLVRVNPIVQRVVTLPDPVRGWREHLAPAESSHVGPRRDVKWLPPAAYARWRDVGIRGFGPDGLPWLGFRGRFAARNSAYTDLMVRTGLRLSEQSALTLFELPRVEPGLHNARTRLPNAVAKNGSGRVVYIPALVLRDVSEYVEVDRAEAVEDAQRRGRYKAVRWPLVVEDRDRAAVRLSGRWVPVARLEPHERRRLFIEGENGLEPAALWLTERGTPMTPAGFQQVFKDANARCRSHGLRDRAHPHILRHSYSVVTLEQLWRGHLQALGEMNADQREMFQMVFGDPLNWLRIRLGHRSVVTTQLYLHTLQELELETRLALIPADAWAPSGFCPQGWETAA